MRTGVLLAMIPGGIGAFEMLLLFAVVLVLFGPRHLPVFARQMGKFISQCQKAAAFFHNQLLHLDEDDERGAHTPDSQAKDSSGQPVTSSNEDAGESTH